MLVDPRGAGLVLGYGADLVFGDPRRGHPVAAFGRVAARLERAWWADSTARGVGQRWCSFVVVMALCLRKARRSAVACAVSCATTGLCAKTVLTRAPVRGSASAKSVGL
jgi:adenosylcobinamide-phosphate synthase